MTTTTALKCPDCGRPLADEMAYVVTHGAEWNRLIDCECGTITCVEIGRRSAGMCDFSTGEDRLIVVSFTAPRAAAILRDLVADWTPNRTISGRELQALGALLKSVS